MIPERNAFRMATPVASSTPTTTNYSEFLLSGGLGFLPSNLDDWMQGPSITTIPADVQRLIFGHMGLRSLLTLRLVDRRTLDLITKTHDEEWRRACKLLFGMERNAFPTWFHLFIVLFSLYNWILYDKQDSTRQEINAFFPYGPSIVSITERFITNAKRFHEPGFVRPSASTKPTVEILFIRVKKNNDVRYYRAPPIGYDQPIYDFTKHRVSAVTVVEEMIADGAIEQLSPYLLDGLLEGLTEQHAENYLARQDHMSALPILQLQTSPTAITFPKALIERWSRHYFAGAQVTFYQFIPENFSQALSTSAFFDYGRRPFHGRYPVETYDGYLRRTKRLDLPFPVDREHSYNNFIGVDEIVVRLHKREVGKTDITDPTTYFEFITRSSEPTQAGKVQDVVLFSSPREDNLARSIGFDIAPNGQGQGHMRLRNRSSGELSRAELFSIPKDRGFLLEDIIEVYIDWMWLKTALDTKFLEEIKLRDLWDTAREVQRKNKRIGVIVTYRTVTNGPIQAIVLPLTVEAVLQPTIKRLVPAQTKFIREEILPSGWKPDENDDLLCIQCGIRKASLASKKNGTYFHSIAVCSQECSDKYWTANSDSDALGGFVKR